MSDASEKKDRSKELDDETKDDLVKLAGDYDLNVGGKNKDEIVKDIVEYEFSEDADDDEEEEKEEGKKDLPRPYEKWFNGHPGLMIKAGTYAEYRHMIKGYTEAEMDAFDKQWEDIQPELEERAKAVAAKAKKRST